jgi:prepilin-type processing-associated H-X9-DG protein
VGGVYECPDQPWGTYAPQGNAHAVTSTYGYNGYYLCPPHTPGWSSPGPGCIADKPWKNVDVLVEPQRLFAYGDTLIDLGGAQPKNNALLDPPLLYTNGQWRANPNPTTCFRHLGRADVALTDGHAESLAPAGGRLTSPRFRVGSVGPDNDPHYVPDWRKW